MDGKGLSKWLVAAVVGLGFMALFFGVDFLSRGGCEAGLLAQAQGILSSPEVVPPLWKYPLPAWLVAGAVSAMGWEDWSVRLPGLLLLAASLYVFHQWGRKVLGEQGVLWAILLSLGSFPLLFIGKIAVADTAGLVLAVSLFLLSIYQLKKNSMGHKWGIVALSLAWAWCSPLQALVFLSVFFAALWCLHPKGKNIRLPAVLSVLSAIGLGGLRGIWAPEGFLWDYGTFAEGFAGSFLGNVAVLGFVPVVLYHAYVRLRQKEELAVLTVSAWVAAIAAASWLSHLLLLFLVGKQIQSCLQKNYPYGNGVKGFTILQVLLAFFVGLSATVYGFDWMGGLGFRKALFFGTPLWMMGIYSLVALYSGSPRHLFASLLLGGVVANLLFWTQLVPLWEAERDVVKEVIRSPRVQALGQGDTLVLDKGILNQIKEGQYLSALGSDLVLTAWEGHSRPGLLHLVPSSVSGTETLDSIKTRDFPWQKMEVYYWRR